MEPIRLWRRVSPVMLVFILLFVSLLSISAGCPVLTGGIAGVVLDAEDGTPIADATVTIVELNVAVTTGTEGIYEFTALPAGTAADTASRS